MANATGFCGIGLRAALAGALLWANTAAAAPGDAQGPVVRPQPSPENAQILGGLARAANGSYAVAWQDFSANPSYRGAFVRAFAADGTPRSGAVLVDPALTSYGGARIAMDGQGRFIAVWQAGNVLHARLFADDASPMGPSFELMRVTKIGEQLVDSAWQVRMAADGRFVVLVETTTLSLGSQILPTNYVGLTPRVLTVQRFEADGRKRGLPLLVATRLDHDLLIGLGLPPNIPPSLNSRGGSQRSSIAIDDAGNFVLSWISLSEAGYRPGDNGLGNGLMSYKSTINARRYNANGVAQGSLIKVDETAGSMQARHPSAPAIAMTPQGSFVVAWARPTAGLMARSYDAAGNAGSAVEITGSVIASNAPSVTVAANGQAAVAWTQIYPGPPLPAPTRAAFRMLGANGTLLTPVVIADSGVANVRQDMGLVAGDALGNIVLGWQTHNPSAQPGLTDPGIALRRFSGL